MNQSILYWKWDEKVFEGNTLAVLLDDMLKRSSFKMLYVSFHHISRPYDDKELYEAIEYTVGRLAEDGRKLLLDVDARNEYAAFHQEYPDTEALRIMFHEGTLDGCGRGSVVAPNPKCGRVGRGYKQTSPKEIAGAWCFEKTGACTYDSATLRPVSVKVEAGTEETRFEADGGAENAGKRFVIAASYAANLPDVFSENIYPFYEKALRFYKDLPLGGVANDEWGFDLILDYEERDGVYSVSSFPLTSAFRARFEREYGYDVGERLLGFAYAPAGAEGQAYRVINDYLALFRKLMRENNDWFYEKGKEIFGRDAFIGVHSTYWGDPYDFGMDILHNAVDWWEVKRDYAQTDEFCIYPIRLALMHKWSSPYWYNMWYSGNTQQLHTYFEETWKNVRFGGRTHYLGYECPNEGGVVKLKNRGGLEDVEQMERGVSLIDGAVKSRPASSLLILFGMEAATNWLYAYNGPRIVRGEGRLKELLRFANGIFQNFNCDLAPSSEISNGSLRLRGGKPVYGSQEYDAVIYISCEFLRPETADYLLRYAAAGGRLAVMGKAELLADGTDAKETFARLKAAAGYYSHELLSPAETIRLMQEWEVPSNRLEGGCVYQDGTVVFTADAVLPRENYFTVSAEENGCRLEFEGNDYLIADFKNRRFCCGEGSRLKIDGVTWNTESGKWEGRRDEEEKFGRAYPGTGAGSGNLQTN